MKNRLTILLGIFLITLLAYAFSSPGQTNWDYFSRLTTSMSQGKLYLSENPSWLNELIPINGKYYVVYPPMPSLIMLPGQILTGKYESQTGYSIFLGAVNAVLVFILLERVGFTKKTSLLVTVLFAFGTDHWYLSSIGSSWFMAHIVAVFFLLLALIETFGKQRLLLIGLFLGASYWSRTTVLFTTPFFLIYLYKKFLPINRDNFFNLTKMSVGILLFILLDCAYNYVRFGFISPLTPYNLIPGLMDDPRFHEGFLRLNHIPSHLEALLRSLPIKINNFPYFVPNLYADALWFTTPAVFYVFKSKKNLLNIACWVGSGVTFFILSLWPVVGFAQFGYRFIQDFLPLLLILIAGGIGKRPTYRAYLLVGISIVINLWGVLLINKFNLYGF